MSDVYVYDSTLDGGCGLGVFYEFTDHSLWGNKLVDKITPQGGCGYVTAGFIEGNSMSDRVLEAMKARWPIVYESEHRVNRNSGNTFYFCVFDVAATEDRYGYDHSEEDND